MIRAAFLTALFMYESAFDVSKSVLKAIIIMQKHILHVSEDQIPINKLLAYAATLAYVKQITEQSRRFRVCSTRERRKETKWRRRSEEVATNLSNWRQCRMCRFLLYN